MKRSLWVLLLRWGAGTTLGMVAGAFLLFGLVSAALTNGLALRSVPSEVMLVLAAGLAGVVEGLAVGAIQAWSIGGLGIGITRWTLATAVAVGLAWSAACALHLAVLDYDIGRQEEVIAFVTGGFGTGALIGLVQWRLLRLQIPGAGWWVAANGAAWVAGSAVVPALLPFAGPGLSRALEVLLLGAAASGLVVGTITGLALVVLVGSLRAWPRGALSFAASRSTLLD